MARKMHQEEAPAIEPHSSLAHGVRPMNAAPLFAHRPPSSGIHLLNDPFPERLNAGAPSLFARAETLSIRREYFAASRRLRTHLKK